MKRPVSLALLVFGIYAFPASAVLDTNQNGLSDLWEMTYNGGTLPNPGFDPQDDPDADGWTNEQEAAAGTDYFDATSPNGFVRPEVVILHDVMLDLDLDEIPEFYAEVATVTWPVIAGKQYTLLTSPNLSDWMQVEQSTAAADKSWTYNFPITNEESMFWRVNIEDLDSDDDGLTDAEEHELGTDPNNPETISGYPDMWLAQNYFSMLINGDLSSIQPDSDSDGDGLTKAQEELLKTNPEVSDNPGILQEAIRNGDFSIPGIDGTEQNPGLNSDQKGTDPDWNYWAGLPEPDGEHSWKAWTEPGGPNIEYQRLHETTDQYVELKAHPESQYGIKQQVGTRVGTTYLLVLDCKDRADVDPACSNFNILIEGTTAGTTTKSIDFSSSNTATPSGVWTTVPVTFTAANVIVKISLVPVNSLDDTTGCLVDNVKLAPVNVQIRNFEKSIDSDQGWMRASELKVNKWIEIFANDYDESPRADFIEDETAEQEDKFRISMPNIELTEEYRTFYISSSGSDDEYNDSSTKIVLSPSTDGKILTSKPMIIVSDTVDNKFNNDNQDDDQTHIMALGGIAEIRHKSATGDLVGSLPVRKRKTVNLDVKVLWQGEGNDPPLSFVNQVKRDIKIAREIYSQAGVYLNVSLNHYKITDPNIDFSDGLLLETTEYAGSLRPEGQRLLSQYTRVQQPSQNDVVCLYLQSTIFARSTIAETIRGIAIPDNSERHELFPSMNPYWNNDVSAAFNGTFLVAGNNSQLAQPTLAHELGHCLNLLHTDQEVDSECIDEKANLMTGNGVRYGPQYNDSKRMQNFQQTRIHQNKFAH